MVTGIWFSDVFAIGVSSYLFLVGGGLGFLASRLGASGLDCCDFDFGVLRGCWSDGWFRLGCCCYGFSCGFVFGLGLVGVWVWCLVIVVGWLLFGGGFATGDFWIIGLSFLDIYDCWGCWV